ncbi:MATE family efflux transporter [Anaerotignum sp.]|uniref:MATE family efflux transporter n=1 Tax=Anaerotignum sp. TaxID=2039241 RepID=UPI0028ACB844|nr:MATE family efflux transporter [Anaerotignum sp.]
MTEQVNPLGTEKVSSLLLKFSVPAIIGMIVNALYNIVDRIFIGNAPDLGSSGLAGITIGFPIMIILLSIGILFGAGGATLFSIKLGEGKLEEADETIGCAFTLLLISGALFLILGQIFLIPLLKLFGASTAILPYSTAYMRVIFFGAIFQVVSMGMNNFLRADGQPRLAMITMFVGAGINIILDPIFIYVFKMGMVGAALATILSQFISMTWILSYFLTDRTKHRIRLKNMKMKKETALHITSLGLPGFLTQFSNSILNIVLNKSLLFYGGDIAVSGMGIINSVQTILLMPIIGLNQGVQPIISFNFGAKKYDRIKIAMKLAMIAATIIVFIGWILTRIFPSQIVSLFNREEELVQFGSFALRTWFWCLPTIGFQILGANFFQAIGRSKSAMFLTLTRQVLLLIPAILIFAQLWGLNGILFAAPFADGLSAILTGIWFYFGIRKLVSSKE